MAGPEVLGCLQSGVPSERAGVFSKRGVIPGFLIKDIVELQRATKVLGIPERQPNERSIHHQVVIRRQFLGWKRSTTVLFTDVTSLEGRRPAFMPKSRSRHPGQRIIPVVEVPSPHDIADHSQFEGAQTIGIFMQ